MITLTFECSDNVSISGNAPSSEGMVPLRPYNNRKIGRNANVSFAVVHDGDKKRLQRALTLSSRKTHKRFESRPRAVGIVPVRLFSYRFKPTRSCKPPNSAGIVPVSFCERREEKGQLPW